MSKKDFNQSAPLDYFQPSSGWERTYIGGDRSEETSVEGISAKTRKTNARLEALRDIQELRRRGLW